MIADNESSERVALATKIALLGDARTYPDTPRQITAIEGHGDLRPEHM
jgi:hypothetical protein